MRRTAEDVMLDPASELQVPDWLSLKRPGIAALAQTLYGIAIAQPSNGFSPPIAEAVRRLAADPQMERVWRQLFSRQRSAGRNYQLPADKKYVRAHPHFAVIEGLSRHLRQHDPLQEQACMIVFSVAVGFFVGRCHGLHVRTRAEVSKEVETFRLLAASVEENANECGKLGLGSFAEQLRGMADFIKQQAERRQSVDKLPAGEGRTVPNPWIVRREGRASKNPWLRGFVIEMALTCRGLFGQSLPGIIAIIATVAFGELLTEVAVRGMTKTLT
jgi:hypothetical protein